MTIVAEVASFKYTSKEENWEGDIFCPLLMRHGPPPKGVKWYGSENRPRFTDVEAKKWVGYIVADCERALNDSNLLSHYKQNYRNMLARKIKNLFVNWCKENTQ